MIPPSREAELRVWAGEKLECGGLPSSQGVRGWAERVPEPCAQSEGEQCISGKGLL